MTRSARNAARNRARGAAFEEARAPHRRPARRSACRLWLCIATIGIASSAATSSSSSDAPQTELTMSAPAIVRRARDVGLVRVDRDRRAGKRPRRRVDHRNHACHLDAFVDRSMARDASTRRRRRADRRRRLQLRQRVRRRRSPLAATPSPENESGVTLTMPITYVRVPPSASRAPRSRTDTAHDRTRRSIPLAQTARRRTSSR